MISNSVLTLENVEFSHPNGPRLLKGVNLAIAKGGEIVFVLGPSGSGKTTLLYLILGLKSPEQGRISAEGSLLPMFQQYERMLLPWMSIGRNIQFGAANISQNRVDKCVSILEIGDILDALPKHVSGGQRQRCILARAIARHADLLVLDEPLSNIDRSTTARILPRMREHLKNSGTSAVWVTHDPSEAAHAGDRILVLRRGGRLTQAINSSENGDRSALAREISALLE